MVENNLKDISNNKGITLVILVIMIVVMLIISATVINLSINKNGVIDKTQKEKNRYLSQENTESTMLNSVQENLIDLNSKALGK